MVCAALIERAGEIVEDGTLRFGRFNCLRDLVNRKPGDLAAVVSAHLRK